MSLPQVSYDRIKAMLDEEKLNYEMDKNDGEIGIAFEDLVVWINCTEKVLRFYAFWRAQTEEQKVRNELAELAHSCNSEMSVPKVVLFGEGNTQTPAKLSMEYSVPISTGLTDSQLASHFVVAMRSFYRVIGKAEEKFPELITWEKEEA